MVFTLLICPSSSRLSIYKLKLVVNGILGVVPKLERWLGGFEPGDIVRLNFQMRRQIVKKPHLVPHIQVLNCLADFLNRAHASNLTKFFPDEKRGERMIKRQRSEVRDQRSEIGGRMSEDRDQRSDVRTRSVVDFHVKM